MNKIKINDIEIRYNSHQNIEYIKNVIKNNYYLFSSLLGKSKIISLVPTDDVNVRYISDFDNLFYEMANIAYNNEDNKKLITNYNLLSMLYLEILFRRNSNNDMALVKTISQISDESLYSTIAYVYYMKEEKFDDFVDYLKNRKDFNKIFGWLKNETRFDAYNYLLDTTINYFKQSDPYFLDNINDITDMMLDQLINNVNTRVKEKKELSPLTIKEFDNLFYEFLNTINAPDNWKKIYDELKANNKISFIEQLDDIDESACYTDENGDLRIKVSSDGTVKYFYSFVHEFIHYITIHESMAISQFSISEFPSIFFEKVAIYFLKNKGYIDFADILIEDRKKNNIDIFISISTLFNDICTYFNSGPLLKTKKLKIMEKNFKMFQETRGNIIKLVGERSEQIENIFQKFDISEKIDENCDYLTNEFIENGLLIINGYQYLLGTFLAEEALKQMNVDDSVIPQMIDITDNLNSLNLKDILTKFNIENITVDTEKKEKIRTKNRI